MEGAFAGGHVSSDGGLALLREADRRLGLTEALARALPEWRDPARIEHSLASMVRQRVFGVAMGYEDLNDHDARRGDPLWQTAAGTDAALASSPTLCRLENRAAGRKALFGLHRVLFEQFAASFKEAPAELVLDFDATDDRVHGAQEGRHCHGYYGDWCFLPLYVFCGERLLVGYLRPSNIDASLHAGRALRLLVAALRARWPKVRITLRADSGFCRWRLLRWCEANGVDYLVGLARNRRLQALSAPLAAEAEAEHARTGQKARRFGELLYKAGSWDVRRRVLAKAERTGQGPNPRYVVTNLAGDPQALYDGLYCQRGEMENRIKEVQLGLFSDRTSCHRWWPNPLRVLWSAAAHVLLEAVRRVGLAGTELERAQAGTIRVRLLKVGTVVLRNTRRVRLLYSSAFPLQGVFAEACRRFAPA